LTTQFVVPKELTTELVVQKILTGENGANQKLEQSEKNKIRNQANSNSSSEQMLILQALNLELAQEEHHH